MKRTAARYWVAGLSLLVLMGIALETARAQGGVTPQLYLPKVIGGKPEPLDCDIPNTNYASLTVSGPPLAVNPATSPDVNLGYPGYALTNQPLTLILYDGKAPDTKAPQFRGLFGNWRTPAFTHTYQRYRWDENGPTDTYSPWPVTVLGMGVTKGETIYTPDSGYDIGGGYEYMVMYAEATRITIHIGREDDFPGYVAHIEDVCVDPDLLALYNQLHAAGRDELPALKGHQPFGKATGSEIKIAIRDTGHFLDPRSQRDWWQ